MPNLLRSILNTCGRLLALGIVIAIGYAGYRLLVPSIVTLPPITTPPAFNIDYAYYFPPVQTWNGLNIPDEINKDIKDIKNAGFGGIKIGFHFNQTNTISQDLVNKATKAGIYPLGILIGHDQKSKDRAFTESELKDWESFTRENVRKFKNSIYFWEVWNEPNMTELRFRYGTPQEFLDLLERTYNIIKKENPQAQVIVNSDMSDRESRTFTEEFLSLNSSPYYDILSLHPYGGGDTLLEENIFNERIAQQQAVMEKYHVTKPLMISEIGQPDEKIGELKQADLAEFAFNNAFQKNLPIVWFNYSDKRLSNIDGQTGWGIVRTDGSFKPAYERLKRLMESKKMI